MSSAQPGAECARASQQTSAAGRATWFAGPSAYLKMQGPCFETKEFQDGDSGPLNPAWGPSQPGTLWARPGHTATRPALLPITMGKNRNLSTTQGLGVTVGDLTVSMR